MAASKKSARKYETKLAQKFRSPFCLLCNQKDGEAYKVGFGSTYNFLFMHHTKPFSAGGGTIREGGTVVTLCMNCHKLAHTVNGRLWWGHVDKEVASTLESLFAEFHYIQSLS